MASKRNQVKVTSPQHQDAIDPTGRMMGSVDRRELVAAQSGGLDPVALMAKAMGKAPRK